MDYKDKLEEAKKLYKTADGNQRYILERLFPEIIGSEDERMVKSITRLVKAFYDCNFPTLEGFERKDILDWVEKKNKQKSIEWSEEDECKVKDIIYFLDTAKEHYANTVYLDACIDWLKCLRPQPKQVWSEEDEKRANRIAAFIWKNRKGDTDEVYQQERDIDWLKSLKDKYTWKPTKEQINALDEVYKTHGANSACRRIIITLLNDLKKL